MGKREAKGTFWILLSFLLAMILSLVPLPSWVEWFRPEWLLMVIIYWGVATPHRVSIGIAWVLGLLLDAFNGTLLGEHALAMVVITYIVVSQHRRIRVFPLWQQGIVVLLLTAVFQLIVFMVQGAIGQIPQTWLYWMPTLTSMMFWPWVYAVLREWRRRFKIA